MTEKLAVYLEVGEKRAFAGALAWPGWCRSAKTEERALETLVAYGARYAEVVARTRHRFAPPGGIAALDVTERLRGNATTDFGAPGIPPAADQRPLDGEELDRQLALLEAVWEAFDAAAAAAEGRTLRKGPRGGGRELPKIVAHVLDAERGYLTQLGSRPPATQGAGGDVIAALRTRVRDAVSARARGEPPPDANRVKKLWAPRYFVRRAAWHVLDHAWEIQDRAEPG